MRTAASGLTYAVGDIHGRDDLLEQALDLIADHAGGRTRRIVFLGDYVDRGPASRQAIDRLIAASAEPGVVCLKGNHEALMLGALDHWGGPAKWRWLANGGETTLLSYGVDEPTAVAAPAIPAAHRDWLTALPLTARDEHRIYVHAGLAPNTPLAAQKESSLLWIREAFLSAAADELPAHVVHGHTPYWAGKPDLAEPERLAQRTNLDTGAFATGVLAIGVFADDTAGGPVDVLFARGEAAAKWLREPKTVGD